MFKKQVQFHLSGVSGLNHNFVSKTTFLYHYHVTVSMLKGRLLVTDEGGGYRYYR